MANVYSGELLPGNVAVTDGDIAYVGRGEAALGCGDRGARGPKRRLDLPRPRLRPRRGRPRQRLHTTTHLLGVGFRPEAMARVAARVRELGGGIVVIQAGGIVFELALPITGTMTDFPFAEVVARNREVSRAVESAGYPFHDMLYTLLFLTCDFLPAP